MKKNLAETCICERKLLLNWSRNVICVNFIKILWFYMKYTGNIDGDEQLCPLNLYKDFYNQFLF